MKIGVIVQARLGSTRLPGKVLEPIEGRPMLWHVLFRAGAIPGVGSVILATTDRPEDRRLEAVAAGLSVPCFFGSVDDVLDRLYRAARTHGLEAVVRVTADCPLLDPEVSGRCVSRFLKGGVDYVSNTRPPTFPDGLDTEVFSIEALEAAWREARLRSEREHVTPFIWKSPHAFRLAEVRHEEDLSGHRWSVDRPEDLDFIRAICERLRGSPDPLSMRSVLAILEREPSLRLLNAGIEMNEGYSRSVREDELLPPRRPEP